jgi:hypothetical protein
VATLALAWTLVMGGIAGVGPVAYFASQLDLSLGVSWSALLLASLLFVAIPFLVGHWLRYGMDGLLALEINEVELAICRRVPPLPERRTVLALRGVTAFEIRKMQLGNGHYLHLEAGGKRYELAAEVDRSLLEWIEEHLKPQVLGADR